jgi:hypothetical protein
LLCSRSDLQHWRNWPLLPSVAIKKTLASNQEKSVSGIEVTKARLTVAACSNASGTHLLPVFVIVTSCKGF